MSKSKIRTLFVTIVGKEEWDREMVYVIVIILKVFIQDKIKYYKTQASLLFENNVNLVVTE